MEKHAFKTHLHVVPKIKRNHQRSNLALAHYFDFTLIFPQFEFQSVTHFRNLVTSLDKCSLQCLLAINWQIKLYKMIVINCSTIPDKMIVIHFCTFLSSSLLLITFGFVERKTWHYSHCMRLSLKRGFAVNCPHLSTWLQY